MKFSEGKTGRVFVLRLEDGDKVPAVIEEFAAKKKVLRGACFLVGGIRSGGKIVVGPEKGDALPVHPMLFALTGVHEIAGVGMLFPDEKGRPRLHMHAALGRKGTTRAGCIRPGLATWKVGEVIILEIKSNKAGRKKDPATGFELLEPSG